MPLPPSALQRVSGTVLGHRVAWAIIDRAGASLHDAEHLPRTGGVLLVGNHAFLGIDAFPFAALLSVCTGRLPRFLGDRNLFRLPGAHRLFDAVGAVPGAPDDAVRMLREGEVVCVYPGGVDDAFKLSDEAYTLKWGDRAGFARAAMRARVPIVPFAGLGIDEMFDLPRKERRVGRRLFGSPRYDLPLPRRLLPRRVALDFHLLPPVDTSGDPDDPAAVDRVRDATRAAIERRLAAYRSRPADDLESRAEGG